MVRELLTLGQATPGFSRELVRAPRANLRYVALVTDDASMAILGAASAE